MGFLQIFLAAEQRIKRLLIALGLVSKPRQLDASDYHKPVASVAEGNNLIKRMLSSQGAGCVLRMGATETQCCAYYHRHANNKKRRYSLASRRNMCFYSGFFPSENDLLDRFARRYLTDLGMADGLALLRYGGENILAEKNCPNADLMPLRSLEPWFSEDPWTGLLKGKKVLVVHPFEKTIRQQFGKREYLFSNKNILPDFQLRTLKAVQTIAGEKSEYKTWFEALDSMCQKISAMDFDIAIIGAGAYGLPLAVYVKSIGKKAVHMGGVTQLLFGIKGKRWDNEPSRNWLYNEYWVRPKEDEIPPKKELVEGGCYW